MKETILIKIGEIALKGLNRRTFEDVLVKNIRRSIYSLGEFDIVNSQSTISVTPKNEGTDIDEAAERIGRVFGIAAYSKACIAEKDIGDIKEKTVLYSKDELLAAKTFKIEAKRSDKKFIMTSPEICAEVGGFILDAFPHLSVDVHDPEAVITVEIRDRCAFIRGRAIQGAGGIPVGTGGKAGILISGGIDSPVAAYMMAKRGIELTAIHFASPPYTSERSEQKVRDLLKTVSKYSGYIKMLTVPFTEIQETIEAHCPEDLFTVIMRRLMMKISSMLCESYDLSALITGESLGQVASQTIMAIACTDDAADVPVFRPLIGMDKDEIVRISRKIGTFETSILPYDDCCTVFTPKHPRTRPVLKYVKLAEEKVDFSQMINRAVSNIKVTNITEYKSEGLKTNER